MESFKKFIRMIEQIYHRIWNTALLRYHHVQYDPTVVIHGKLHIFGQNIMIGKDVRINCGYRFNPVGGDSRTILRTYGMGVIEIGNHTGISNSTIVAYQSVKIGKNVLIGGSCKVYDTDFHALDAETRIEHPADDICSKPIVIEDGAFIGAHSIILKGVTIGRNSIVGAGSVVTRSIPAGNPAKFIRKLGT